MDTNGQTVNKKFKITLSIISILIATYCFGRVFLCKYIDHINSQHVEKSNIPIDIVLVATKKDFEVVPYTVASIKKYLKQPIKRIVLVSSKSPKAEKLVKSLKIDFLDEDQVLNKKELENWFSQSSLKLNYQNFSWYYQQFLKLLYYKYSIAEHYLVIDADIVMNRPFVMVNNYNITTFFVGFNSAKELSSKSIELLLGNDQFTPKYSYIADLMCFDKQIVKKLIDRIESKYNTAFYKAVFIADQDSKSRFSEYELYGSFANHSQEFKNDSSLVPSVAGSGDYYVDYLNSIHFFSSGHSRKRTTLFWDRYDPTLKAYPYIAYHSWIPHYKK